MADLRDYFINFESYVIKGWHDSLHTLYEIAGFL